MEAEIVFACLHKWGDDLIVAAVVEDGSQRVPSVWRRTGAVWSQIEVFSVVEEGSGTLAGLDAPFEARSKGLPPTIERSKDGISKVGLCADRPPLVVTRSAVVAADAAKLPRGNFLLLHGIYPDAAAAAADKDAAHVVSTGAPKTIGDEEPEPAPAAETTVKPDPKPKRESKPKPSPDPEPKPKPKPKPKPTPRPMPKICCCLTQHDHGHLDLMPKKECRKDMFEGKCVARSDCRKKCRCYHGPPPRKTKRVTPRKCYEELGGDCGM